MRLLTRRIDGGVTSRQRLHLRACIAALIVAGTLCLPTPASATTAPFSHLASGYTQALYGIGLEQAGAGVAFASNGDPLTSEVGGPLTRFSSTTTKTVEGSVVHTSTTHANSALSLGLATSTNSVLYDSSASGLLEVDPSTGATIAGPLATKTVGGNEHSIAADPLTGRLVFADGNDGSLSSAAQDLSSIATFSDSLETGINYAQTGDGMTWDPTGSYLFLASPLTNEVWVLNRSGAVINRVAVTVGSGPDGLAFHEQPEAFLVSNNNDGSITRYDFPSSDYTTAPTQSTFASGGTRGDQSAVGPDGCLYVVQGGTQYANGTLDLSHASLVRICGNFLPAINITPPTVTKLAPAKGPVTGGTTVKITGSHFTGVSAVRFGATNAAGFKVSSAASITAVSPAEPAGTVDVTVTTSGGTSSTTAADHFKFFPTVTGVSPAGGSTKGGTSVTVTGAGFAIGTTATTIKFGTTKAASVNCVSETTCMAVSPAHVAGMVDVKATVSGLASPKAAGDRYTYS